MNICTYVSTIQCRSVVHVCLLTNSYCPPRTSDIYRVKKTKHNKTE